MSMHRRLGGIIVGSQEFLSIMFWCMSIYLEMLQRRYEKLYHTEAGGEREYASWYDVFCFF